MKKLLKFFRWTQYCKGGAKHWYCWRIEITKWEKSVAHTPKELAGAKLVRIDMQAANGPQCRELCWWLYFPNKTYRFGVAPVPAFLMKHKVR